MREAFGNALIVYGGLAIVLAIVLLVFSIPFSFSDNEDYSVCVSGVAKGWALRLGVAGTSMLVGGVALLMSAGKPGRQKKKPSEYRRCFSCDTRNPTWHKYCQLCGKPLKQNTSDPLQSTPTAPCRTSGIPACIQAEVGVADSLPNRD